MLIEIGRVQAIFRYPVKSMAGERLDSAQLGWHGIEGDRRLALRRLKDQSGFPWLTATRLPELVRFTPLRDEHGLAGELPTHVRAPEGKEMEVFGDELALEIERRHSVPVQMMHLRTGIFDDACVSIITEDTVTETGRLAESSTDARRFRPNLLLSLTRPSPFEEDQWVGGVLRFGDEAGGPRIGITKSDPRCSMVNIDPDSGRPTAEVLKAIVRVNGNNAGVYGTVIRKGRLTTGQSVCLEPGALGLGK